MENGGGIKPLAANIALTNHRPTSTNTPNIDRDTVIVDAPPSHEDFNSNDKLEDLLALTFANTNLTDAEKKENLKT